MTELPLRIGDRAQFTRVRERVRSSNFDETSIRSALNVEHLWQLGTLDTSRTPLPAAQDSVLALLIRAFLSLERVPVDAATRLLGAADLAAFEDLGLLIHSDAPGMLESPVLLYPVGNVLLASDRHKNANGSAFDPPTDAVFPAIFPGTTRFLRLLPTGSFDAALDIGSATGVAALTIDARTAVAADITPRSLHFADFNRHLNDRLEVEVVCGDLYEPVAGRDFDCIVAHPPYMPTVTDKFVFRDGGETGESLLRQIVTGLPKHLRPGGTCLALSAAWDTAAAPFEARVREWLSEDGDPDEYHVLLAVETEMSAAELAERLDRRGRGSNAMEDASESGGGGRDAQTWITRFAELGLARHVYGALVVKRLPAISGDTATNPRGATRRTTLGASADGAALVEALRQMAWRAEQESAGTWSQTLAAFQPRLAASTRLLVTYNPREGALVPGDAVLERAEPFLSRTRVEPWMLSFIGAFDGQRSLKDLYAELRAKEALPNGFDLSAFLEIAGTMLDRGYLEG